MGSGLYDQLVQERRLLPHAEVNSPAARPNDAYKVLEPTALDFVSYPYEWCFSQMKDAALSTLAAQRRAVEHGMTLKDASAFNVQFRNGQPQLVDTLSFESLRAGEPWVAYRQFCQHFLAPLALMATRDVRLSQLLRSNLDGVPLDLASRLLPRGSWLSPGLLIHVHLHASAQQRFAGRNLAAARSGRRGMGRQALLGLIDSLERAVRRLDWDPAGTAWAEYERFHGYPQAALSDKERLTDEFLDRARPQSVWDLGANVGRFSRRASRRRIPTLALDLDPAAVELNYRRAREEQDENLLPLVLDLTNPSPALGWAGRERMSLAERGPADAVFVLALVHHLAITNNLPLGMLAEYLASLGRWLLIEFIPKEDPQVQRLLASRVDIFPQYSAGGFEPAFQEYFVTHRREPVGESGRWLYWMERRV